MKEINITTSNEIKTIDEKFFISGKQVGVLSYEISLGIPGLKETKFPVSVRFGKEDLPDVFSSGTLANSKTEITVTGEIDFHNLTGEGKITVNEKDSVMFN